MRIYENTTVCEGCGLEFHWPPLAAGDLKYCCCDCRDGFICNCRDLDLVDDQYSYLQSEEISKYEGY
ncbi:MAG: hypothetical protein AB9891_16135 [Anaerolineaceae bacterium]